MPDVFRPDPRPTCPTKTVTITITVPVKDPNPPQFRMKRESIRDDLLTVIANNAVNTVIIQDSNKRGFLHPAWIDGSMKINVKVVDRPTDEFWIRVLRFLKIV